MKKIILLLAISFAIGNFSFGQTVLQQNEPRKMELTAGKHKHHDGPTKNNKAKHKHKHHHKKGMKKK